MSCLLNDESHVIFNSTKKYCVLHATCLILYVFKYFLISINFSRDVSTSVSTTQNDTSCDTENARFKEIALVGTKLIHGPESDMGPESDSEPQCPESTTEDQSSKDEIEDSKKGS